MWTPPLAGAMSQYRRLGATGLQVFPICCGCGRFGQRTGGVLEVDRDRAHAILDAYDEAGGNFLDTANMYGQPGGGPRTGTSEEYIGEWMATRDRDRYVLASKVSMRVGDGPNEAGLSRKHVREEIEGTLDRLGTDHLDVYYLHRWDETTPVEETLSTLSWLVESGRVHHVGASSMAAWRLAKALWTADREGFEPVTVTQPLLNAASEESAEYLALCAGQDLAVVPHSPLAGGFLTGKYERGPDGGVIGPDGARADLLDAFERRYVTERGWRTLDAVRAVADEVDATPAQVALRWLVDHPLDPVPVVGARDPEQMRENLAALDRSLTDDQRERITAARDGEVSA